MSEAELRLLLRERAGGRCEYCHVPEFDDDLVAYHIDHIIAVKHDGNDELDNLAWSCPDCNWNKGTNIAGILDGKIYRLFHPRIHPWKRHFQWEHLKLDPRTKIGGVTEYVLGINDQSRLNMRETLWLEGLFEGSFPPPG